MAKLTIEEIMEKYKDEYGYVRNLDIISALLKSDESMTVDEKSDIFLTILKHNLNQDEINKKKLKGKSKRKEELKKISDITEKSETIKNDTSLMDVTSYINSLKNCEDDDFLTELLPSIYDNNYESIITSILLYFYREISLAYKMIKKENDEESLEYLRSLVSDDKKIIDIIKEYNKEEEQEIVEDDVESLEKNKLIFLPKLNDSLFIYQDIDNIAIEDDVIPILKDIKDNKINREKRFHNHQELKGISALRKRDSRIIFARLDNNIIVILGILVKRFQNPNIYAEMLQLRTRRFKAIKDELKVLVNNIDFVTENEEIYDDIIMKLTARNKSLVKGDIDGTHN